MKKSLMALSTLLMLGGTVSAQKVTFEEYTLNNGLHVILHQDNSAPVVITSVMYHVGAKDENPERKAVDFALALSYYRITTIENNQKIFNK
jgi:hypothetical protein